MSSSRPAVFLDRDDTLIANREITAALPHPGDLFDPALVRLLPGAAEACARLAGAGFPLVVVTNQGAVARGLCTVEQVERCNTRMRELLRVAAGVELTAVYVCPYHPGGIVPAFAREHPWRKPAPGMLLQAGTEHDLDLRNSWMIGDAERDVAAGINAGLAPERCLRIALATPGLQTSAGTFPSLREAAERVLRASANR